MTKAPKPTEKSKKQSDNTSNNPSNALGYTTIVEQLKTVNSGNNSGTTGMVKPVNGFPTSPVTETVVLS